MATPNKTATIESHKSALLAAMAQPAKDRETIAAVLSNAEERITKPIIPDVDSYIDAQSKIPILKSILADIDFVRPDDRARQAGDAYVAAHAAELVALSRAELTERTKNKQSMKERFGAKVASISTEIFSALSETAAADARARREKVEAEAEAVEFAIAQAVTAIRNLEIMPSVDSFRAADARVHDVYISASAGSSTN